MRGGGGKWQDLWTQIIPRLASLMLEWVGERGANGRKREPIQKFNESYGEGGISAGVPARTLNGGNLKPGRTLRN